MCYFCPNPVVSQNDETLWKNLSSLRNLILGYLSVFIVQVSELFLRKMLSTSNFLMISFYKEIIFLDSVLQEATPFFLMSFLKYLIFFDHGC